MNREQQIEKVESLIIYSPFGASERDDAERILDAILPRVSTVEELEALPARTALVDRDGRVWRHPGYWSLPWFRNDHDSYDHRGSDLLKRGPLTVVWQP